MASLFAVVSIEVCLYEYVLMAACTEHVPGFYVPVTYACIYERTCKNVVPKGPYSMAACLCYRTSSKYVLLYVVTLMLYQDVYTHV